MKTAKLFLLVTICFFTLNACKKKGCTNSSAENYSTEAKKDDGSCTFKGNAVIWFNTAKVIEFSATGTTNLYFYLDGTQIGTLTLLDFINTPPDCGGAHAVSVERDLGSESTKGFSLVVKGDQGTTLDTYTLNISGNKCTKFLLN
jgi:hypothetical protein